MIRGLLALTVGLFATFIVVTFCGASAAKIWPPPESLDLTSMDLAQVKAVVGAMSLSAKAFIVAGSLLAAFAGGLVTTLAARHRTGFALVPGALVAADAIVKMLHPPQPLWMLATTALLALPMAWLGARLGVSFVKAKPEKVGVWKGGSK